jgi:hypothetical protein
LGLGTVRGFRSAVLLAVTAAAALSAAQAARATVVTLFQENFQNGASNKMGIPVAAVPVTNSSGSTISGGPSSGYVGDFSVGGSGIHNVAAMTGSYSGIAIPSGVTQLTVSFESALQDTLPSDGSYAYLKYALFFNNSSGVRVGLDQGDGPFFTTASTSFQPVSFTASVPSGAVEISPAQWTLIYQGDTGSTATVYGSDYLVTYTTVPEPATLGLVALGELGILLVGKRRKTA